MDNNVHSYNVDVAKQFGVIAAVLLNNLAFWIGKNVANNRNYHDGRTWTYNSIHAWQALFPEFSPKQIRHALEKLVESGVLLKGNYNSDRRDRTIWYAFSDNGKYLLPNVQLHSTKGKNATPQNGTPLPDIKHTDNNTPLSPNKRDDSDLSFDAFWNLYPKKVAKHTCLKKWEKLSDAERSKIMETLPVFVRYKPFESYQHPNPSTYLNQKRWEDELPASESPKKVDTKKLSHQELHMALNNGFITKNEYDTAIEKRAAGY